MKQFLLLTLCTVPGSMALAAEDDLARRVEALEYQSYANTLSWNGFFETRYDQVTFKPEGGDKTRMNLSRNLAGIDFKSQPLPNVSIFGRFAYSSVFNNFGKLSGTTGSLGRPYANNELRVERLFINYGILDGLTFSAGRLPTLDGPPGHLWDGLSRQGSYPRQVYSSSLDGYALTYNIPLGSATQQLSARLVYTPLSHIDVTNGATGVDVFTPSEIEVGGVGTGTFKSSTTPLTSWMLDYSWDGSGLAQNITAIYQGFQFKDFKMMPGWKIDYSINALYVEVKDIASLGLTVYESYAKTKVVNEGGVTVAPGVTYGIGAAKPDATVEGAINLTGLTYTLPVKSMNHPLIGYEIYDADKNSLQFEASNRDPIGFYVQRGKGSHIFYTQPINANIKLRLGLMDSKPDYAAGMLTGEVPSTKDKVTSIYANLRTDF
ncbi:hypothetical protein [Oligoflexus tunisiensis]|uniref:hypothetical protein n=1 Tax=Oligoflexus tunisiensis TaxID=708132 RepID=UPI00159F0C07|nr:hypothetical protein [Oligoflexus tunisiensis]